MDFLFVKTQIRGCCLKFRQLGYLVTIKVFLTLDLLSFQFGFVHQIRLFVII